MFYFLSLTIFLFRAHADSTKATSSETDCNDNVPSHKNPAPSQSKHAVNGFFQQQMMYDSLPTRAASVSVDSSLYNLPRSYSQDVLPKASPSGTEADGELYVFNTPSGTSSVETQMRHVSISYDIPPTPSNTYQIPRTFPERTLGQTSKLDTIPDIPPPRPPKPHPAHDRSPVDTCGITRTASDTDGSYCTPSAGVPPSRSNTISTVDLNKLRKGQLSSASTLIEVHARKSVFICSFKHGLRLKDSPLFLQPCSYRSWSKDINHILVSVDSLGGGVCAQRVSPPACSAGREKESEFVLPGGVWPLQCLPASGSVQPALSPTLSASQASRPSNGAEEQEVGQPQSLSESYSFLCLCAIMAPSVSHLLGSISFLPR